MTERDLERALHASVDDLRFDEAGRAALRKKMKESDRIVKRKMMTALVVALGLVLALGAAVAAGLGVFGRLGEAPDADRRLPLLEQASAPVGVCVTLEDGVTVTVDRAYWDGSRVFVSYTATGLAARVEPVEGDVPQVEWNLTFPGARYGEDVGGAGDGALRALLEGGGCAVETAAFVGDNLRTPEGGWLDIVDGYEERLPDGTALGWKECVPEEGMALEGEAFTCCLSIARSRTVWYQDESGLYGYTERTGKWEVPFTLRLGEGLTVLGGAHGEAAYAAVADMRRSPVDVAGTVTVTGPADWARVWADWGSGCAGDMICDWQLLLDGEPQPDLSAVQGVHEEGTQVVFEIKAAVAPGVRAIALVPVYTESGAHPAEAIPLTTAEPAE